MKIADFDRVLDSLPADRVAARVTGTKRPEYEFEPNIKYHWKAPPPETRPIFVGVGHRGLREGEVFGRFTVVGAFGTTSKRKSGKPGRARYVVRCACGDYELRTAQDLRANRQRGHHNACFSCMRLDNLKRSARIDRAFAVHGLD